ncbi:hypothetical protein HS99_0023505 [Kitasatospora aureofaciens]|uniref:Uncharacterized protein n=1 Tax=Kitasatospora aureofaciens TaxID=1894 RepID=A0A1E7NBT7_KITAU|nr:hypothetical protein [Kitasatospora aureofaciens]OEV38159.1 hypothetical protein HS99_0023505 [Kitasatospora aureofaciens]
MSSRESDNANPTPRRTGPDAYPSGTPPYGTPGLPGGDRAAAGTDAGSGGEDDGPRTETTLTTRVRINIPGSRPIPPVVVRSTVKNETAKGDEGPAEQAPPGEPGGPRHRSAPASPVLGVMEGGRSATPPNLPPEWQIPPIPPATSESESTGAWFRPRQKKAPAAEPAPATVASGAPSAPEAPAVPGAAEARPQGAPNGTRPTPATDAPRPNGRPVPAQGKAPKPGAAPSPASPYGAGPAGEEPGVYEAAAPFAPVADPFAPVADPFAHVRHQLSAEPDGHPERQPHLRAGHRHHRPHPGAGQPGGRDGLAAGRLRGDALPGRRAAGRRRRGPADRGPRGGLSARPGRTGVRRRTLWSAEV